jgi:hypothetical protein
MTTTVRKLQPISNAQMPAMRPLKGERAELCLLPLDRLVVDDRYQRQIGKDGRANALRIAAAFDWRKFTPVIVTPQPDGRFAIIDGQHRATAALTRGDVQMVPCMVVQVTPEEAAEVFAAINGQVTRMTALQIYAARLAAKEGSALLLERVLAEAGVRVLRYKFPGAEYEVGDTLAIGTLEGCLRKYGRDVLKAALLAVTRSFDGNPGCLTSGIIRAMCEIMAENPGWRGLGETLWEAMDEAGLADVEAAAATFAKRDGKPRSVVVRELIEAAIRMGLMKPDETAEPRREGAFA